MLIYHSCAVTSHKYRGMFSLLELKIDFKKRASVWPSVANCIFRTIFVFHWPCSPSQHEKVMNMGVMRIPEFDKFYRVKANEFFEPYL